MASIETLIAQIDDAALREKLGREVAEMKKRLDWGLVFERHLPENIRALSAPIKPGSVVWERQTTKPRRLRVRSIEGSDLLVVPEAEKRPRPRTRRQSALRVQLSLSSLTLPSRSSPS